jgi:EpsI family protein
MPDTSNSLSFFRRRSVQILTVVLAAQAIVLYGFSRTEMIPKTVPLSSFPVQFGSWRLYQEGVVEKEVMDVLRADDVLNRTYVGAEGFVNLFVAFFKTQRAGQAPHSPKNCLPGSGWVPEISETISIPVAGEAAPIPVNRYIVQKGDEKSLVLYWYQSRNRVVASEYTAKFYVVADAMRYNRTDTSLVRIVVPFRTGQTEVATRSAEEFVQTVFPLLRQTLPQ